MTLLLHEGTLSTQLALDADVEVTRVLVVSPDVDGADDFVARVNNHIRVGVEYRLFPVRVMVEWSGAETNSTVTFAELNVKEAHESMNVVIPTGLQTELALEVKLLLCHCRNVDRL